MFKDIKPKVLVSKCLGFDSVRYNGQMIPNDFITQLKNYVEFIPVCPEVEIGLGVPRDPIRLVQEKGGDKKLLQPATGKDVTSDMVTFIDSVRSQYQEIDGMILKSQSADMWNEWSEVVFRY